MPTIVAWVRRVPGRFGRVVDALRVMQPFESLPAVPDDLDVEVWDGVGALPSDDALERIGFYVMPYTFAPMTAEVIRRLPNVSAVQTLTAGYEHVVPYLPDGVTLCNARGVHDSSTAELAVTLTLASLRGVPGFVRQQDRGDWAPGWFESLADKTVLVVGYGSIGQAIESRLLPFECDVLRVARTAREGVAGFESLPQLLGRADVVILIVPLTEQTQGMVDASFLAAMRDGALLVNVARGPVVDTDALVAELATGRLRAAMDVTDPEPLPPTHPLWTSPNVLISPHVGGTTTAFLPRAQRLVRSQLERFAAGEPLANVVVAGS
ncbi:MAG TPA: 2-hydroxyacid dehydrogenase [Jiangellaceae bacterium]